MQLHRYLHALGTALPLFTSAALAQLAPWKVASIQTWQPSGRPGSSPNWYIHANITNPDPEQCNTDPAVAQGQVYCEITWVYPNAPYNQVSACQIVNTAAPTPWSWTVELLEGDGGDSYPVSNFALRWRAASTSPAAAGENVAIFTGVGSFLTADNLQGNCAASGFCQWYLNPADTPFLVNATSVSCAGPVAEALLDANCE
ncbi:hypothetical protein GGS24DRAFT_471864 [Hypoxylon argillaceum]|nr:hypothetical protein GGS24DRAFT_471864 [Hypoxylon argillaceum]KAI1150319.1 hypothetical protein F4825DRAFT_427364 [Nemania diffusa]